MQRKYTNDIKDRHHIQNDNKSTNLDILWYSITLLHNGGTACPPFPSLPVVSNIIGTKHKTYYQNTPTNTKYTNATHSNREINVE